MGGVLPRFYTFKGGNIQDNYIIVYDALPSPKLDPRWALASKKAKLWGLEGTLLAFSNKRGRNCGDLRACSLLLAIKGVEIVGT
jgi:hypothetical protein